ncbi:MAG: hypothetical protein EBR40_00510 [Proteobacteria bacterium]|jgi:hypothetical protein|nr:hypothetical protein [Pseudomonadota bacterium]
MEKTKDLTISLPEGYASGTQRYALLLSLDPGMPAAEIATRLKDKGLLPRLIVAVRAEGSNADAASLLERLTDSHRILEAPQARWICGTGHSAAEALRFVLDHPDLAGRAACLSTSFEGAEGAPPLHSRLLRELEERVDLPAGVKLFLDYGTIGLDECYEPYHRDAGAIFRAKGWTDDREFRITRSIGGSHDPASWRDRLSPALCWLAER